jgi:hypothetical protein
MKKITNVDTTEPANNEQAKIGDLIIEHLVKAKNVVML